MSKIQHHLKIIAHRKLSPKFFCLSLAAPALVKKIRPGQFVHIKVNEGLEPFFRRPFSVYRAAKDLEILYEVVGTGSRALSLRKPGEFLDVLGPLGNGFSDPPARTRQVVMVAGGVGVAPFLTFSDRLKKKNVEMLLLYGARTKDHVYPMREFKQNGCRVFIATDDGSVGVKGRVCELYSKIRLDAKTTVVYTCGPRPMMASLKKFVQQHDLRAEANCEEKMACGLGACLGCSIRTSSGYQTVCHDGPVFDIREIAF